MKALSVAWVLSLAAVCNGAYVVKGPEAGRPWETNAVHELQSYLGRRVAGALRVEGHEGLTFHVGDTALARAKGVLSTQLPEEAWVIRSYGTDVVLNGGGTRGALFAVSRFLEDYCGVRWWNDFEEDVPAAGTLDLPKLDVQGRPAFRYRDIYHSPFSRATRVLDRRVRLNGPGDASLGGAFAFGPPNHCHTFDFYVPFTEHGATHPEWFSLRKGKRVGGQREGQLCLTNPELRGFVQKRMFEYIEKGIADARRAGLPPPRIYDFSHNDNGSFCECSNCCAAAEKYGRSGVNLNFVNPIAEAVAKKYPDALISTFAYQFTLEPPKGGVRAADNVLIRLCDTESSQPASILEEVNRPFREQVVAWSRIAKNLSVWDYAIVFTQVGTGLPFASEFHYGDLFRHYRANNVMGIFWEHEMPYKADMWELKFFLETKLMEDPDLDCEALIARFMREYYGPAGAPILKWRRALDALRKEKNARVGWFPSLAEYDYCDNDHLVEWEKLLDEAEAAVAGDVRRLARVRRARTGLDRLVSLRTRRAPSHNIVSETKESDAVTEAARRRLTAEDWPTWAKPWTDGAKHVRELVLQAVAGGSSATTLPPPPEFATRHCYDFTAPQLASHASNVRLVADSESCCGMAMRTDGDGNVYAPLPYGGGLYDTAAKKGVCSQSHAKIDPRPGYHWYRFGKGRLPPAGYIWFSRAWTTQLVPGDFPGLVGLEVEIWAHVKFTGPLYWPDAKGASHIWIDRVLLVRE